MFRLCKLQILLAANTAHAAVDAFVLCMGVCTEIRPGHPIPIWLLWLAHRACDDSVSILVPRNTLWLRQAGTQLDITTSGTDLPDA